MLIIHTKSFQNTAFPFIIHFKSFPTIVQCSVIIIIIINYSLEIS